jgi:hypothetical protein
MVETVNYLIHEVLGKVDKAKTKQEKIDILREYDSNVMKNVLIGTFNEKIEWNLPPGDPPYTPAAPESAPSTLNRQLDQLLYFIKGNKGDSLSQLKREFMFIRLLESIHPADAKIVLAMVAKKLPVKGLTKALVQEAFPNLIR